MLIVVVFPCLFTNIFLLGPNLSRIIKIYSVWPVAMYEHV
jgi:hypothetical protein